MFTGIITHTGAVKAIDKTGDWKFTIAAEGFTHDLAMGASIACSAAPSCRCGSLRRLS